MAKAQKQKRVLNFEKELWQAADKLRGSIDASEYKHIVLGLIFLRYISDSFEERQKFLEKAVADPKNKEYFTKDKKVRQAIIKEKDEYLGHNVFFVPSKARWSYLQEKATSPQIAKLIDSAMELIEQENPKQLKGVLPKVYVRSHLEPRTLGELINLFTKIPFEEEDRDKDILGRIYEYFLGQFASAEGKRGSGCLL